MAATTASSLTAAGARYTTQIAARDSAKGTKAVDASWQTAAWDMYLTVPEVNFVASWTGGAMSAATLYAARILADGTEERLDGNHPATEIVNQIAGGPGGQAELLGAFGPHLVVAGEGWIVVQPKIEKATGAVLGYDWRVLSTREVSRDGKAMKVEIEGEEVTIPPYDPEDPDETAPIAIRVWQPSPVRYIDSISPVRTALIVLEELQLLNAAVAAVARSRITGRGVLLVPKGVRFPTAAGPANDVDDDVVELFMEVASTAIKEPGSAAATVPIILEVPADTIANVKWLTFESDFDELAIRLRDECIRRFAIGTEIPPEIVQGMSDTSHWGIWMIQAEGIRRGVEPKLRNIANVLTKQWVRPLLEAQGEEFEDIVVGVDTSELRTSSNKAASALEAYKEGLISAQAARREMGFDEADAPETGEAPPAETPGGSEELPVSETQTPPATEPGADVISPSLSIQADISERPVLTALLEATA